MSEKKPDYRKENKVVVSNEYIRAVHPPRMSISAMKLFRLTIMQCRKQDTGFYEVEYKLSDVADIFQTQTKDLYRDLVKASINMLQTVLTVADDKGRITKAYTIFSEWEYLPDTSSIRVRLNDKVKPLFLQLRKNFTQIPIAAMLTMKSKYAIRLYELICEKMHGNYPYADVATEITITLEEARAVTGTDKKKTYDRISNFRDKVLLPSIKEIEEDADWKILLENLKTGRRVTGYRLEIWSRNGYEYIQDCKEKGILPFRGNREQEQIHGQLTIYDYLDMGNAED